MAEKSKDAAAMAESAAELLHLDESDKSVVQVPTEPAPAAKPVVRWYHEFYKSADWLSAYIGLTWFAIVLIMTAAGYTGSLAVPAKWVSNPFSGFDASMAFLVLIYFLVGAMIYAVMWLTNALKGENPTRTFAIGFTFQFVIAVFCMVLGQQETLHKYGLGYEIWAIVLGTIIINVTDPFLPMDWSQLAAGQGEFYIKCGLVLLGVDLEKVVSMGFKGMVVGWVVPPLQIIFMWLIGTRVLKMDNKVMVMVLAIGASVCGCSAMAAAAPALNMKKDDLNLCISLLTLFTLGFTFLEPLIAIGLKLSEDVAGAFIGGSVNNTANVIAAAGIVGPEAVEVAGIVKMIQNCALGFIVVGCSVFWSSRGYDAKSQKPGLKMLWDKFPKFALGFFTVSIVITILSGPWDVPTMAQLEKLQADARSWLFTLGFVGIGLTTNIPKMLRQLKGGKEVAHYLVGQTFNICVTLLFAWLMFDVV